MPMSACAELRNSLQLVAKRSGVKPSEFHDLLDLRSFLIDADEKALDARELAATALAELHGAGNSMVDYVICIGVLEFLDFRFGSSLSDEQRKLRLQDCVDVAATGKYAECRKWLDLWF